MFQLTSFLGSFFMILLQIQQENNFLPTSTHLQPKFIAFLVFVCMTAPFIAQMNVWQRVAILASVAKQ